MKLIKDFCQVKGLGQSFYDTAETYYLPLISYLVENKLSGTLILGVNGAQGSGKSTLAEFLANAASVLHGWQVTCLSLDDIYLTKSAREVLAKEVHPLLRTRGVPGTHDLGLGEQTLDRLCQLQAGESLLVPRFDKASDDQFPKSKWDLVTGQQDLVIFEGWCVGCLPQLPEELDIAVNSLESKEDTDGAWRAYVNQKLVEYEERLWSKLNLFAMLKVPSFEQVYEWRSEQEAKLVEALGKQTELTDPIKLKRFISHYERLTRHMLNNLGSSTDVLMELDLDHSVFAMHPSILGRAKSEQRG